MFDKWKKAEFRWCLSRHGNGFEMKCLAIEKKGFRFQKEWRVKEEKASCVLNILHNLSRWTCVVCVLNLISGWTRANKEFHVGQSISDPLHSRPLFLRRRLFCTSHSSVYRSRTCDCCDHDARDDWGSISRFLMCGTDHRPKSLLLFQLWFISKEGRRERWNVRFLFAHEKRGKRRKWVMHFDALAHHFLCEGSLGKLVRRRELSWSCYSSWNMMPELAGQEEKGKRMIVCVPM